MTGPAAGVGTSVLAGLSVTRAKVAGLVVASKDGVEGTSVPWGTADTVGSSVLAGLGEGDVGEAVGAGEGEGPVSLGGAKQLWLTEM